MEENKHHVYFLNLLDIKYEFTKIGKTSGILDRMSCYNTSSPLTHCQIYLIIECNKKKHSDKLEKFLHKTFEHLSTTNHENYVEGAGKEWFQKDKFTVEEIKKVLDKFKYKNECRIIHGEELDKLMDELKRKEREPTQYSSDSDSNSDIDDFEESIWKERDYQKEIIPYGINKLNETNKFYLELGTGGGKSYIVYNILKELEFDFLIILSPRKKINSQNIDEKYTSIINKRVLSMNLSKSNTNTFKDFMRFNGTKIITACINSIKKLYNLIEKNKLSNIAVWFDEAHFGVENWDIKINEKQENKFFLTDKEVIKYRIFSSASPNRDKVLNNEGYFGEIYRPIKINQLIEQKWLCGIKPHIIDMDGDCEDLNLINLIFNSFKDNNRKWGFSFHNKQQNAFNLFHKHFIKYLEKETDIVPFLLVGDDFKIEETKIGELKELGMKDLDYYKDISNYEARINSIGYVVQKLSMGYDFSKIDYLIFTDPKYGYKDIIQSIGRGTRPDKMGENGRNKDKCLIVDLPTNFSKQTRGKNEYERIGEVLKYLIYDVGLEMKDIKRTKRKKRSGKRYVEGKEYSGDKNKDSVEANILKILGITWNQKKFIEHISGRRIYSTPEYVKYRDENKELSLPDHPRRKWSDFCWEKTLNICDKGKFYTRQECIEKIGELLEEFEELDEDEDVEIYLNEKDYKIPNSDLVAFYGGERNDFMVY